MEEADLIQLLLQCQNLIDFIVVFTDIRCNPRKACSAC